MSEFDPDDYKRVAVSRGHCCEGCAFFHFGCLVKADDRFDCSGCVYVVKNAKAE